MAEGELFNSPINFHGDVGSSVMQRTMVFIDYQNFNINLKKHYENSKNFNRIDYFRLGKAINEKIPIKSEVIKTYLFAYKPCDTLMTLNYYSNYYDWLTKLKVTPYLEIIEGRQEIRIPDKAVFNINDPSTYYTEEKETDINLATHMVSKAFQNAFDVAILISGDTDYIKVIETLHSIGKVVVIAHFKHQNISRYNNLCDAHIVLYDDILEKATIKNKNDSEIDSK